MEYSPIQLSKDALISQSNYGEKKDCLVVTMSIVTGLSYKDAHALCELAGRKVGDGWYLDVTIDTAVQLGYKFKKVVLGRRMSASTFMRENPVGRFYVTMKGHAFAIIDGKMFNNVYLGHF